MSNGSGCKTACAPARPFGGGLVIRGADPIDRLWQDLASAWLGTPLAPLSGRISGPLSESRDGFDPILDLIEEDKALVLSAELPGMTKEQVQVDLREGVVRIKGTKEVVESEEGSQWHRRERSFGSFERSFALPVEVDSSRIEATFQDGVLKVVLPKAEPDEKAHSIEIRS